MKPITAQPKPTPPAPPRNQAQRPGAQHSNYNVATTRRRL